MSISVVNLEADDRGFVEVFDDPAPRRFTRDEYYRMAELGFFVDRRVEMIDGEIFEMSPQNNPHANAVSKSAEAFLRVFGPKYRVRIQANLRMGRSEPEPDLAVVPLEATLGELAPESALLVMEISASTLAYDRSAKAGLYAANGIEDYWLLNLGNRTLEVRRTRVADPATRFGYEYQDILILSAGGTIRPLALPGVSIAVTDLLP